jgi:hypothetical protein
MKKTYMLKQLDTLKLGSIYVNIANFSNFLVNFKNENECRKLKYFFECINCYCQLLNN